MNFAYDTFSLFDKDFAKTPNLACRGRFSQKPYKISKKFLKGLTSHSGSSHNSKFILKSVDFS